MKQKTDFEKAGKNLVAFGQIDGPAVLIPTMVIVQALKAPIDHKRSTLKTLAELLTAGPTVGVTFAMVQSGWIGVDRKEFLHYLTCHEVGWFWNLWQFKNLNNTKYSDYIEHRYGVYRTAHDFGVNNSVVKLALGIYYELFQGQEDNEYIPEVKKVLDGEQSLEQCFPKMSTHELLVTLTQAGC